MRARIARIERGLASACEARIFQLRCEKTCENRRSQKSVRRMLCFFFTSYKLCYKKRAHVITTTIIIMSFFTSYSTIKFVRIADVRLAVLRLFLLLAIVGYVVVIEMIKLGGYLESNRVEGVVEFSLREPTVDNCDPSAVECMNNFQPLNELEYCAQHHNHQQEQQQQQQQHQADANDGGGKETSGNYTGKVNPCQLFEAELAKTIRETSIIIWTRASIYNQTLICDGLSNESESAMTCPKTYRIKTIKSIIHRFTLLRRKPIRYC